MDFVAIADAVAVGVRVARIGAGAELLERVQAVVIDVEQGVGRIVGVHPEAQLVFVGDAVAVAVDAGQRHPQLGDALGAFVDRLHHHRAAAPRRDQAAGGDGGDRRVADAVAGAGGADVDLRRAAEVGRQRQRLGGRADSGQQRRRHGEAHRGRNPGGRAQHDRRQRDRAVGRDREGSRFAVTGHAGLHAGGARTHAAEVGRYVRQHPGAVRPGLDVAVEYADHAVLVELRRRRRHRQDGEAGQRNRIPPGQPGLRQPVAILCVHVHSSSRVLGAALAAGS